MEKIRKCGCKGCRTCLFCENLYEIERKDFFKEYQALNSYVFCFGCKKLYSGWDVETVLADHKNHDPNEGLDFPGISVIPNFLTTAEGANIISCLDSIPWQGSQSGRRKQHFGPKTNFKKMKLQVGEFNGFPDFSQFIQDKFKTTPLMESFQTIEQCTLEYEPTRGASIDPHIDDCWIWGERVVTVNCLGDSVLTLVKYNGDESKYNLKVISKYKEKLICDLLDKETLNNYNNMVIRIPMPNLSIIMMYGPARYQYEHSVLREDIKTRRVCLAYREFTPMYLEGGEEYEKGKPVTERAEIFVST